MKKEIAAKQFSFTTISILFTMLFTLNSWPQQQTSAVVPHLVRFGGVLTDLSGKPLTGTVGVTFSLYTDQQAGVPLWLETQNVVPDRSGHYSVQLGSTKPDGIPTDLFTSGEARWLGVQPEGQAEQPRVLLLSVPYALKAGDAETLGGLPASAFVLAALPSSAANNAEATSTAAYNPNSAPPATNVTGSGTLDFIPLWTSTSNIANSVLFQSGSGSTAKVGINTTTPAAMLDVKGTENVEGLLTLPATGAALTTGGKNSQAEDFIASSFNSGTAAAVNQTFQWRAEPAGNNTTTPSGTLNLLFGSGPSAPTETGLKLSNKGLFTFATGQAFPGTGTITGVTTASGSGLTGGGTSGTLSLGLLKTCTASQTLQWNGTAWACASAGTGTITGVTAGTDLTGGGTGGNVTLNVDTTKVAQLKTANSFTGNQSVAGNVSATGSVTGQTGIFSANNSTQVVNVTQSGSGAGITTVSNFGTGLSASGGSFGVNATSATGFGVYSSTTNGLAIYGTSQASSGSSVEGYAGNTTAGATSAGVLGYSVTPSGVGTYGLWTLASATGVGTARAGIWGDTQTGNGVVGTSDSGIGVYAQNNSFSQGALYAENDSFGPAGYFKGGIQTTGKITTYNNIATVANGVSSIVAQVAFFSGGSGDNLYQNLYTPTNDGIFRIIAFQECAATSGGSTIFSIDFAWTLPSGGQGFGQDFGGSCGSLSFNSASVLAHVKGGTPIQFNYSGMDAPFQTTILVERLL
jgi:hypothetical protein